MKRFGNERGVAIIFCYMVLGVLAILGGGFVVLSYTESRTADRHLRFAETFYLAEAGLDQAIVSMRSGTFAARVSDGPQDPEIAYTSVGQEGGFEADVDPVAGRPNLYRIQATGYYPNRVTTSPGFQKRVVEGYVEVIPGSGPPPGLFGDREVDIHGSVRADSYDSRTETMQSTGRGLIGSNGTAQDTIRINGSADVFGDVLAGPGSPPEAIRITGSSRVSGKVGPAEQAILLTPVEPPPPPQGSPPQQMSFWKKLQEGWESVALAGEETTTEGPAPVLDDLVLEGSQDKPSELPGGTYRYHRLRVGGEATLTFTGPAILYVDELDLTGNKVLTAQGLPANLVIKVVGSGDVRLSGVSGFYGVIYAPQARVRLSGNNRLYGSLTGSRVDVNGSVEFWYDEALQAGGGGSANQTKLMSWSEID